MVWQCETVEPRRRKSEPMASMKQARPLADLFAFLQANHRWNDKFQALEYRRSLAHCANASDRLMSLLHATVNTQSAPSIGKLGLFWRSMSGLTKASSATRLAFTENLEGLARSPSRYAGPWERLFLALGAQPGWGKKTAALFASPPSTYTADLPPFDSGTTKTSPAPFSKRTVSIYLWTRLSRTSFKLRAFCDGPTLTP